MWGGGEGFGGCYFGQSSDELIESESIKNECLASRDNGFWNFLEFGGGEEEVDVVRWFFEGFEEGVEGAF